MSGFKTAPITAVTHFIAKERSSSVFVVEIRVDGRSGMCETHATLRDDQLSRHDILRTLIVALEDSLKHYRKQFADLLGDSVNDQERAEAVVKGMLLDTKPEGATYSRPLENGHVINVFPSLFGAGTIHLGKQGDSWSSSVYDYNDVVDAVHAAAEWSGEGDPKDGWVRHWPSGRRRPDGTPASEVNDHDRR